MIFKACGMIDSLPHAFFALFNLEHILFISNYVALSAAVCAAAVLLSDSRGASAGGGFRSLHAGSGISVKGHAGRGTAGRCDQGRDTGVEELAEFRIYVFFWHKADLGLPLI